MPRAESSNITTSRRRKQAVKPAAKPVQEEVPEGWDPSDDEEEEYVPPSKRARKKPQESKLNKPTASQKKEKVAQVKSSPQIKPKASAKKRDPVAEAEVKPSPQVRSVKPKVKLSAIVVKQAEPEQEQSDPDDPAVPVAVTAKCAVRAAVSPVVLKKEDEKPQKIKLSVARITSCLFCKEKDGKNMNYRDGIQALKHHYSNCLWTEELVPWDFIPHGQGSEITKREDLDLFGCKPNAAGRMFKYKCPYGDCDMSINNTRQKRMMGYKELWGHCLAQHNLIEKALVLVDKKGISKEKIDEVVSGIREAREEQKKELVDMPSKLVMEEISICRICKGESKDGKPDKDAKLLSLKAEKLSETRYHYINCLWDFEVHHYLDKYEHKQETNEDGMPKDLLGRSEQYECTEKGCKATAKKKMGYRALVTHSAREHGGLKEILEEHPREDIRELATLLYS